MPTTTLLSAPLQFKNATKELRQNHAALFERLQVKVKVLGSWAVADVEENQKDGAFTEDIAELPPTFKDIQDALEMPRFYKVRIYLPIFSTLTTDRTGK
jgi:hypothetical protein